MKINDVVIVGGGPVGLFMGLCLHHRGIPFTIFEKRTEIISGSRSLGIHPPSLELFDEVGISEPFLEAGIKVLRGHAHDGRNLLGTVSFEDCPKPHNYILLLAQSETERILRERILDLSPDSLIEGAEVTAINQQDDFIHFSFEKDGQIHSTETGYLIGCDGKNSFVRESLGIKFHGKKYPDTYVMGDFEDSTDFESDAVVYLPKQGLIESFPLPEGMRRWVVKTEKYINKPTSQMISDLIRERISVEVNPATCNSFSSFGVQHYLADEFIKDRVLLAGDAAHIVSPIGGQGMNLGWIDAWHLANVMSFCRGISKDLPIADMFVYETRQKPMARKVAKRAELNMKLGRASSFPSFKHGLVKSLLGSSQKNRIAKFFTMRELENWWI